MQNFFFLLVLVGTRSLAQNIQQQQKQQQQQRQKLYLNQYPLYDYYNSGASQSNQDNPTVVYHFIKPQQDSLTSGINQNIQRQGNIQLKQSTNEDNVQYLLLPSYAQPPGVNPVLALQAPEGSNDFQPQVLYRPLQIGGQQNVQGQNYNQQPITLPSPPPEYKTEKGRNTHSTRPLAHVTYLNPEDSQTADSPARRRPVTRIVIKRPQAPTQKPYSSDSGNLKQSDYTNIAFTQPYQGYQKNQENQKTSSSRINYPSQYFPPPPTNRQHTKYLSTQSRLENAPSYSQQQSYPPEPQQSYNKESSDNENDSAKDIDDDNEPNDGYNDVSGIPGDPGKDYPVMASIPSTTFSCENKLPGYYADKEQRCQVYYFCDTQGHMRSFLCPNGTVFNQLSFVCEWWYNVDCSSADKYYSRNSELYKVPKKNITQEKPVYFFIPRSQLDAQSLKNYQLQQGSSAKYPQTSNSYQPSVNNYQSQSSSYKPQQQTGSHHSPPVEYKTAVAPAPPTYRSAVTAPIQNSRDPERQNLRVYGLPRPLDQTYNRYNG